MIELDGKKLLIIKLRYIGDSLSLLPVIENLKEKARDVTVDVMVNKGTEEALTYNPGIRTLLGYDRKVAKKNLFSTIGYHKNLIKKLRLEKYDFVIDFTHNDRAAFLSLMTGAPFRVTYRNSTRLSRLLMNHVIDLDQSKYHIVDYQLRSLELFGLDHFDRTIRLYFPDSIDHKMQNLLSEAQIPQDLPKVVIHPGARGKLRRWRPERFSEIARRLRDTYEAAIILVGGPGERGLVEAVEKGMGFPASLRSNDLSLLEMAALLNRCQLFIGNDSAPGHLAAAVNCPSLTLFGPTFPHMWRPLSSKGEAVFKDAPCCGCRQEACIRPDNNCMDLIEVDEVWEKVKELLITHSQL